MSAALLEAKGISKRYGATQALDDVDISIGAGEVVALIGENGAGKSTLGKVLAGAVQPDTGEITVNGEVVHFRNTSQALKHGVAIVLQEFNLIPEMSVAENLSLTRPDGYVGGWWKSSREQRSRAVRAFTDAGIEFDVDVDTPVSELSVAQQQIVEIVKSITLDARLFILDEPTAALGKRETESLLSLIRALRDRGCSVVIVTHRLDEVYAVADRMFVLRDGVPRGEFDPAVTSQDDLIPAMVGRTLDNAMHEARHLQTPGDVVLSVRGLSVEGAVEDCSFEVRAGEIVGIAGLVGSGRTELVRAVFGADHATSGEVTVAGKVGRMTSPLQASRRGMALVPEDRKTQGVHIARPIYDNIVLAALAKSKGFMVPRRRLAKEVDRVVADLRIKTGGLWQDAGVLSGGNQQKVALAKWLLARPDLMILDEPTRGIDVGARGELYKVIDRLVADGMAVLMVSSELPEVIALSDRVLVMSRGRIVSEVSREDATEESILAMTEVKGVANVG
ncbi:sugar ABC transporter ATP-binding protein [Microbacterium aquimaris]|uniref:Sugar ABC transporter ATP-binding protein n=1 Tax=Microbacterium aquimaris TaxID=459816 RepID=A0ABU5N2B4_9MICO|nr:sugar ABC transporter ATP-binding protein [Microbacterium aquimaris]MDZ8160221.1 sugar ABC transporter ATP-binding protein [Microbacterium aquimaris]